MEGSNPPPTDPGDRAGAGAVLVKAWRAAMALRLDDAVQMLARAERWHGADPGRSTELDLLRAFILVLQDEAHAALSLILAAERSATGELAEIAAVLRRYASWKIGDVCGVCDGARLPAGARRTARWARLAIYELSIDAAIALDRLDLHLAKRLASDAFDLAESRFGRDSAETVIPASLMAQVLYEGGYLREADLMMSTRLPAVRACGAIECALRTYSVLARIAVARGRGNFAVMLLQEAEAIATARNWSRLAAMALSERIDLMARLGRSGEAEPLLLRLDELVASSASRDIGAHGHVLHHALMGRGVAAMEQSPSLAIVLLRQLRRESAARQSRHAVSRIELLLVEALLRAGNSGEASSLLRTAIEQAAASGFYQGFVEAGPSIPGALAGLSGERDDPLSPAAALLVRSLSSRALRPSSAIHDGETMVRNPYSLTGRERDILQLVSVGQSNKKIAQILDIAPETVKSHVKHIFAKLASGTRAEAVAKAQSLGLI